MTLSLDTKVVMFNSDTHGCMQLRATVNGGNGKLKQEMSSNVLSRNQQIVDAVIIHFKFYVTFELLADTILTTATLH